MIPSSDYKQVISLNTLEHGPLRKEIGLQITSINPQQMFLSSFLNIQGLLFEQNIAYF